jgi:hypothetical protein
MPYGIALAFAGGPETGRSTQLKDARPVRAVRIGDGPIDDQKRRRVVLQTLRHGGGRSPCAPVLLAVVSWNISVEPGESKVDVAEGRGLDVKIAVAVAKRFR